MNIEQQLPEGPLTAQNFEACGYEAVLRADPDADYFTMCTLLRSAALKATAAGQERSAAVLGLLADACSMVLAPQDKTAPFRRGIDLGTRRSKAPEDVSSAEITLFAAVTGGVAHRLLRARLADLIWLRERSHGIGFVLMAIDAYREAPPDAGTWFRGENACWRRALQLALLVRSAAGARVGEMETALVTAFLAAKNSDGHDPKWFAELLLTNRLAFDRRTDIAAQLEAIGLARSVAQRESEARSYFDAAGQWFAIDKDSGKQSEMMVNSGGSWEKEGDAPISWLAALNSYEKAIQCFRAVPGPSRPFYNVEQRITALRGKLAAAGTAALGEMQSVQTAPVDITPIVDQARAKVAGKDPLAAMFGFARLYQGANADRARTNAEKTLANSLTHQIFGTSVMSSDGRIIAKQSAASDGKDAEEAAVWTQMVRDFQLSMELTVKAQIAPALETMNQEHRFDGYDFIALCERSPAVPLGRSGLVAQGLYAGYCGDLVQAVHILVPQVENMVRYHLKEADGLTTTISADGIVMENGMSTLVKLPQMESVFGKHLTFELTALFCDQNGPNLRNEVAHGLLSAEACQSPAGVYAWWFVFRLMFLSFWMAQQGVSEASPQAAPAAATPADGAVQ